MKNATLWKRILKQGIGATESLQPGAGEKLRNLIARAPIIVGPAIETERETGTYIDWKRYAGFSLPFSSFWIERPADDEFLYGITGALVNWKPHPDNADYLALNMTFAQCAPNINPVWSCLVTINTTKDCRLLIKSDGTFPMGCVINPLLVNVCGQSQAEANAQTSVTFILDTLMVMSAKNVSLSPRRQTDFDAVEEATRRNGGHATGYRYHVLIVRPPGARSDHPGEEIGNMPRHVCRGHFAEYGPEFGKGLLFGKYAGRFYVPPHVKGDKKNGVVEKDYEVRV